MMNYELVIGSNSFLGKSFIQKYKNKINILGLSFSKKEIKDFKKNKKIKYSYNKLKKIIKNKNISSVIYFHSYGTLRGHVLKTKIFFSNLILAKKFYRLSKYLNSKFIYFGSVSEYDKDTNNNYAISKKKMIKFLKNDSKISKAKVIILKLFYIYGFYENKNRLFSLMRKSILNKKIFYINNPKQKIDFLHVSDFCRALFKVLKMNMNKTFSEYKLCYGKKIQLEKICANNKYIKVKKNSGFKKINYNILGYKKFNNHYKWKPKLALSKGINDFIKNI